MLSLDDVKLHLRIDSDADDDLIERIMAVADGYMRDAITDYDAKAAGNAAFVKKSEMCQLIIITDLYENRNQAGLEAKDFGYTVRSMIGQMQYTPLPESAI